MARLKRIAVAVVLITNATLFPGFAHDDFGDPVETPEKRRYFVCEIDQQAFFVMWGFYADLYRSVGLDAVAYDFVGQKTMFRIIPHQFIEFFCLLIICNVNMYGRTREIRLKAQRAGEAAARIARLVLQDVKIDAGHCVRCWYDTDN